MQPSSPSRKPAQLQTVIAVAILQWPLVPMTLALIDADVRPAAMLVSWCALVATTTILLGVLRNIAGKFAALLLALTMSFYCTLCTGLAVYRLYTHEWLDLPLLMAMPADSIETIRTFIGDGGVAAVLAVLLAHTVLYAFGAMTIAAELPSGRSARLKTLLGAVILVPCVALAGPPHEGLLLATIRDTASILPIMDHAVYTIAPAEHVFLVQLESLNALAVNGEYTVDGRRLKVDSMPVMRRLGAEGVLFPHIWSPDVQTHRAQQGFLCGALRNLNLAPFFEQVPYEVDCLPRLFRNAGYKTVFLKGVADPRFANANKVMPILGYDDIHFGDIMQPGDAQHLWGYEEGIYFRRAVEYLERTYTHGERLFVHIAVSAHHVSYVRSGHNPGWFHAPHAQQVAQYLASAKQQDAALAVAREAIDRYTGGNAHVFMFGDHSYPLGLYGSVQPQVGATVDNFITPLLYLPPRNRASEFALGRTVNELHGETDLPATIAELTSGKPYPNSLVPFMLRTPPAHYDYERCHVMTQPFGYRSVMIAHGDTAYVYSFATRCIETLRLTYDPIRQKRVALECEVKFEDFERRYMCERYR